MTKAPISCGILAAITLAWTVAASAQDSAGRKTGAVTGLAIPRFVSLKASEVNSRVGPGAEYQIAWVFKRAGLPVEVLAEFENWRQVRDSDGVTGWVAAPLLSARRTAMVAPWIKERTVFALTSTAQRLLRGGPDRARRHCGYHDLRRRSLRGLCWAAKGLGAAEKFVGRVSGRSGEIIPHPVQASIPKARPRSERTARHHSRITPLTFPCLDWLSSSLAIKAAPILHHHNGSRPQRRGHWPELYLKLDCIYLRSKRKLNRILRKS